MKKDEDKNSELNGAETDSVGELPSGGVAWMAKSGGEILGHSLRVLRRTGRVVAEAKNVTARTLRASSEAADSLLASMSRQLPAQIPIGNRIRTRKRIRKLEKRNERLKKEVGRQDGDEADAASDLLEVIGRQKQEIADLKENLKSRNAGAESQIDARMRPARAKSVPVLDVKVAEKPEHEAPITKTATRKTKAAKKRKTKTANVPRRRVKASRARDISPGGERPFWSEERLHAELRRAVEEADFVLASERLLFKNTVETVMDAASKGVLTAIASLKAIQNAAVGKVFEVLSNDSREEVRTEALNALTEQGGSETAHLFKNATYDGSARVRLAALRGLHKLDWAGAASFFIEALSDKDAGVRRRAVTCLAWRGSTDALPTMMLLLNDPAPAVRLAVVDALGKVKSEVAVSGLISALDDQALRVRRAAEMTLVNLTSHNPVSKAGATMKEPVAVKALWAGWWKLNKEEFPLS